MSEQLRKASIFVLVVFWLGSFLPVHVYAASGSTGRVREIGQAQTSGGSGAAAPQLVVTAPIVINEPGAYRLNSNITATQGNAIEINVTGVTLDLNGFNVLAAGAGVVYTRPDSGNGLVVVNGNIQASTGGILAGTAANCRIEQVTVGARNGTGIEVGTSSLVSHSIASTNLIGIRARAGSLVLQNTVRNSGVGLQLDDSTGYANNVLFDNETDVSGGVQIGTNLCASNIICPP
jgi:hypothetical protein